MKKTSLTLSILLILFAGFLFSDEIYTSKMESIKDFEIKLDDLLKLEEEESNLYMNKVLNKCLDLTHGYTDYLIITNTSKDSFDDWTEEDQRGYKATMSSLKIYYENLNVDSQKSSSTFTKDREEYLLIMLQRKIGKLSEESLDKLYYDFGWCNNYIDTARMISKE